MTREDTVAVVLKLHTVDEARTLALKLERYASALMTKRTPTRDERSVAWVLGHLAQDILWGNGLHARRHEEAIP